MGLPLICIGQTVFRLHVFNHMSDLEKVSKAPPFPENHITDCYSPADESI